MIKIAACINKAIKEKDIKVEDDGTITVSEFAELEICVPIEENHLPLPNSDMRTKRVSTQESHIKIAKTRNPRPYVLSGEQLFNHSFNDWKLAASSNLVLCPLA